MSDEKDLKDKDTHAEHDCQCGGHDDCGDDCGDHCGGGCHDGGCCGDDEYSDCGEACACGDSEEAGEVEQESYEGKYLRALADYHNLLKRTAKEKEEFFQYAITNFLQDILPVYDNLKLSVAGLSEADAKNPWAEGVKHVIKQFKEMLEARGIVEIKTVGEKFDHNTMEALEGSGEIVKKELKAGYTLSGKVIVPAKVIVE